MDSIPSPSIGPRYWLSSHEVTDWARPRGAFVLQQLRAANGVEVHVISTDPPNPAGAEVLLAPRFVGDSLQPTSQSPVVVNVFSRPDDPALSNTLRLDQLRLVGVGEVYVSEAEAEADDIRIKAARGA